MFKTTLIAGALALLGSMSVMPVSSNQAAAIPLMQTGAGTVLPDLQTRNANVTDVAYRKWKFKRGGWNRGGHRWHGGWHGSNRWAWNRHSHGPRYGYRWGRYRHYHNGYYYASPWWLLAPYAALAYSSPYYGYGAPAYRSYGSSHTRWCLNRYRSYDPRSDTYVGYDGYRHRCRGPY